MIIFRLEPRLWGRGKIQIVIHRQRNSGEENKPPQLIRQVIKFVEVINFTAADAQSPVVLLPRPKLFEFGKLIVVRHDPLRSQVRCPSEIPVSS